VSLSQAIALTLGFVAEKTGGVRLQSVSVALFRTIGARFSLFDRVASGAVNAADASTGSAADLACFRHEELVIAVEVKDRALRLRHVQDKLPAIREQGIRELLFVTTVGDEADAAASMAELREREFNAGQNIYVTDFKQFLQSCLILFGEPGRRDFLVAVGEALDELKVDLSHRQAWQALLTSM
jgi:hypothetical protein